MVNPGELNDSLIVELENKEATDENGFPITTYEAIGEAFCKAKTVSTKELNGTGAEHVKRTHKFICRVSEFDVELDTNMNILWNDKRWHITHVHIFGDDEWYELSAVAFSFE